MKHSGDCCPLLNEGAKKTSTSRNQWSILTSKNASFLAESFSQRRPSPTRSMQSGQGCPITRTSSAPTCEKSRRRPQIAVRDWRQIAAFRRQRRRLVKASKAKAATSDGGLASLSPKGQHPGHECDSADHPDNSSRGNLAPHRHDLFTRRPVKMPICGRSVLGSAIGAVSSRMRQSELSHIPPRSLVHPREAREAVPSRDVGGGAMIASSSASYRRSYLSRPQYSRKKQPRSNE